MPFCRYSSNQAAGRRLDHSRLGEPGSGPVEWPITFKRIDLYVLREECENVAQFVLNRDFCYYCLINDTV